MSCGFDAIFDRRASFSLYEASPRDRKDQEKDGWLGFFGGFNSPLKQYFSLYLAGCQDRGERRET